MQTIEKLNYPEPYKQISEAMNERGLKEIGTFVETNHPHSIDIDRDGRVLRTIMVKRLNPSQLFSLQQKEIQVRSFLHPFQMKKMFSLKYQPIILSEERMVYLSEFNDEHRPEMRKEFGVTVPPYFPPDMEFDGMEYHHAWDKAVRLQPLYLPELKSKIKKSKTLTTDSEDE